MLRFVAPHTQEGQLRWSVHPFTFARGVALSFAAEFGVVQLYLLGNEAAAFAGHPALMDALCSDTR
jgi:hypothetical protein